MLYTKVESRYGLACWKIVIGDYEVSVATESPHYSNPNVRVYKGDKNVTSQFSLVDEDHMDGPALAKLLGAVSSAG